MRRTKLSNSVALNKSLADWGAPARLCSFLFISLFSISAGTQQANSPVSQPQNDPQSLLSACAVAMGSAKAEMPVIVQGVLTTAATLESRKVVIQSQGRRLFRQDQIGIDGGEAWVVKDGAGFRSSGTQKAKLAAHSVRYFRPDHLPAVSCAPDAHFDVIFQGTDQIGNKAVHHLRLVAKPVQPGARAVETILSTYDLYIDQQTSVVLRASTLVFSPENILNHSRWDTYYSDYRSIGGMLVPFHIENYFSGQKLREINVSDAQLGVALNDADFE